ncbi:MAG: hypothetical protein ACPGSI_16570 [Pikeienuella sp.]
MNDRPHYQEIADARFEREHLARMSEDHMNVAYETDNMNRAFMAFIVGLSTVALVGLMLLFVAQGPKIIEKIAHQIDQVQP